MIERATDEGIMEFTPITLKRLAFEYFDEHIDYTDGYEFLKFLIEYEEIILTIFHTYDFIDTSEEEYPKIRFYLSEYE